jgi:hypothetical protein
METTALREPDSEEITGRGVRRAPVAYAKPATVNRATNIPLTSTASIREGCNQSATALKR